MRGMKQELSL